MTTNDSSPAAEPTILVADDDEDLASLVDLWLEDDYRVELCLGGREALDALDESVDVVLVDRRMPVVSGDSVVEEIDERGLDCCVSMVTAVRPSLDVLEMPIDGYLIKPVFQDEVCAAVDRLLERTTYDDAVQEYLAAASKYDAIQVANYDDDTETVRAFEARLETLRERAERVYDGDGTLDAVLASDGSASD